MSDDNLLDEAVQRICKGEELHQAMKKFDTEIKAHGVSSMEVAIRWLAYHTALGDEDAIILGASKEAQLVKLISLI